jgi:Protein of unknown function (DUF1592)/Protein of unknown function (DUF1588)/Protein of unknown function (DUF1587)/Protein of unknown function (DUF1595)/Protein of unknown function (DUF1585)/Planctomycete cytochrome C
MLFQLLRHQSMKILHCCMFVFICLCSATVVYGEPTNIETAFKNEIKPFLETYCVKCHGTDKQKGSIQLHALNSDFTNGKQAQTWENILEILQFEQMPPEGEKQPSAQERTRTIQWIESQLQNVTSKTQHEFNEPQVRRLTNIEYQNTLRDLLGIDLQVIQYLPQDPVKPYHFNNTANFMLIGREQMDRYLECARQALASAIVDPGMPQVHKTTKQWKATERSATTMALDEIGVYGGANRGAPDNAIGLKTFPQTGEYRIRVQAAAILPKGFDHVTLRVVMGSMLRSDAGTGTYATVGMVNVRNTAEEFQEFEFRGRIENHPTQVGKISPSGQPTSEMYLYLQNIFDNGELNDHRRSAFDNSWSIAMPRLAIRSVEFECPVTDVWPPEHHTRILFDSPLRQNDPPAYLNEVLKRFLSRAFRRPATTAEVERYSKLFHLLETEFETFEGALRETLSIALISPNFLYRTVADGKVVNPHYEFAAKLSYFLWGSMPDAELLALAARGELAHAKVIETQVNRMLNDPRAHDFIDNFVTQWLSIAKMRTVNVNRDLFPRFLYWIHVGERDGEEVLFRPTIRDYMHEETVGFIAELIRRNANVLNIVDSEFAFLNEPLAVHYGVSGVGGLELRPVAIHKEHHLGGLLTHGSVLIGNGTGSAPHPIYRAVWLREALLGDPVSDPPAEVPALTDSAGDAAQTTISIKELLALHRKQESCNDCHARLDPWGIPFEQYNAVGKFQPNVPKLGVKVRGIMAKQAETLTDYETYLNSIQTVVVQANAQLPNGPHVNGMPELKKYLLEQRSEDIVANVIRRLLSYGVGRELTLQDRFEVKRLLKQAKNNNYKIRDLLISICQCPAFTGIAVEENK